MKTKDMVLTGVFAAVICVFAPFTIPIGAVPISLATFAVYLAAAVLGTKKGTLAVLIYILIGMAGVPVFSGFAGGIGKILGVTGGYIIGYIPCAFAIGVFTERFGGKNYIYPLALVIGTLILYSFGTAWFMVQSGNGLMQSLTVCVFPFLVGDAIKIAAASIVSIKLKNYSAIIA